MTYAFGTGRTLPLAAVLALTALVAPDQAAAATRWELAAVGAVAILPAPQEAKAITAATLYCAEQKWSFQFRVEPGAVPGGVVAPASVTVGGEAFALEARESGGSVFVAVPRDILDPLRVAGRMAVEIGGQGWSVSARFSLSGSRVAIDAAAPLCSTVDMSAYEKLVLSQTGPAQAEAAPLMAAEAKIYIEATKREPTVSAVLVERPDGKRLLFSALCGVNWYYGASGCTVSGFAAQASAPEWRRVYSSEGVHLYLDPAKAVDGWPNIVTLPLVDGIEPDVWIWDGRRYLPGGAEDKDVVDTVADQFE